LTEIKKYRLTVEIPGVPKLPNRVDGEGWRSKAGEAKKWRGWSFLSVRAKRPKKPLQLARVTLTRFSSREPDYDNLVKSFKHVMDGLIEAGIILDDAPKYLAHGKADCRWVKVPRKDVKIKIEVEDVFEVLKT